PLLPAQDDRRDQAALLVGGAVAVQGGAAGAAQKPLELGFDEVDEHDGGVDVFGIPDHRQAAVLFSGTGTDDPYQVLYPQYRGDVAGEVGTFFAESAAGEGVDAADGFAGGGAFAVGVEHGPVDGVFGHPAHGFVEGVVSFFGAFLVGGHSQQRFNGGDLVGVQDPPPSHSCTFTIRNVLCLRTVGVRFRVSARCLHCRRRR